jgi:hypothetical protein
VDATAWAIHGQIHQRLPQVRVVLHLHPVYTTSLACLATPQILPIDQNTARYFNRVAVDTLYGGMADTAAEGARLAGLLADKRRLLMGNHGVLVTAATIGEAFDDIWTLERACQILVTAWSTGQPLKVLSAEVAEKTAQDWEKIADFPAFAEMKQMMIDADPRCWTKDADSRAHARESRWLLRQAGEYRLAFCGFSPSLMPFQHPSTRVVQNRGRRPDHLIAFPGYVRPIAQHRIAAAVFRQQRLCRPVKLAAIQIQPPSDDSRLV